jgi:hypothetical protein
MPNLGKAAKAIFATITSALAGLSAVLVGHTTISNLSAGQWVSIGLWAILAGGAVYGVTNAPNTPPAPRPPAPPVV